MTVAPLALALALAQPPAWIEPPPSATPTPTTTSAPAPPPARPPTATPTASPIPTATAIPDAPFEGPSSAVPAAVAPTPPPTMLPPPPGAIPPPPEITPEPPAPAPARRAVDYLEFSIGVSAPVGSVTSRVRQEDLYGPMAELELQVGARVGEHGVAGGYAGVGIGNAGTKAQRMCSAAQKDECATMMARLGALLRVSSRRPGGSEPWALLGLGARVDSADVPDAYGTPHSRVAAGPEARLGIGIDLAPTAPGHLGQGLGFGLFLDGTLFQPLAGDAIPELGVHRGRRPLAGWIGGGIRLIQH